MKRLPKNKRNQLIGVIVGTIVLICAVYFLLILPQKGKNRALGRQITGDNTKLQAYRAATAITNMDAITTEMTGVTQQLSQAEEDVASGDLYAWTYDTMRRFKANYRRLEIATIGQPTQGDCDLIGDFPYKQIRFSVTGTAYYHDLGKFVSDFENTYPHCRVVNLSADPAGTGERLTFRMDIVALVKTNT